MASFEISLDDSNETWDELYASIEREAEIRQAAQAASGAGPVPPELEGMDELAAFFWGGLWIR